jgi:hypothetical protein
VVTDRLIIDPEALAESERLREITSGDVDGCPARPQLVDQRPHDQDMRAVR